jgi:hypothetical protein
MCRRSIRAGKFQQLGRSIDGCYFKSGLDECFCQGAGATPHVHYSSDFDTGTLKTAHDLACCAPCQGFKCCCLNIREIALVQRWHPQHFRRSAYDLQLRTDDGALGNYAVGGFAGWGMKTSFLAGIQSARAVGQWTGTTSQAQSARGVIDQLKITGGIGISTGIGGGCHQ